MTYVDSSVQVILSGQHSGGGYVACPTFPTYDYAWLRDGAWCAYAAGLHGHDDSAAAFHRFIARTVKANANLFSGESEFTPPTRYTLTGQVEKPGREPWPNFQLDGYGTWLWVLGNHIQRGHRPTSEELDAAKRVARYLQVAGSSRCYDCWEEHSERRHTSTLGAVIAGLAMAAELFDDQGMADAAARFRTTLFGEHVRAGSFVKHDATDAVDASLLWLATPLAVVAPDDPVMVRTAQRVADELTGPAGGVRRYLGDTYYGGGEWVLLTAWLGWHYATLGDFTGATGRLRWVEAAFTVDGRLPEQLLTHPQSAKMVAPWIDKWGPVATPLLWSHAMHLILVASLHE
ncbi:glycoside hydrolase family 15 protein [Amycolatopsis pigmentata]|uniref:Glycoside hydrolase family 15 protein n=1 Tax=Amycolatopsis pigmentata TaxID=450801 RepID=A0ABW5FKV5_9PSEU